MMARSASLFQAVCLLTVCVAVAVGCASVQAGPDVPLSPASTLGFSGTLPPTRTPMLPFSQPPTPTPFNATATPDPFVGLTIDDLSAREYGGGAIEVGEVDLWAPSFTRYKIFYPSDGLAISGLMDVPNGPGPFPVVVVAHGYFDPDYYYSGRGSAPIADYLAERGYLTIMPDYRNYGDSDFGPNPFRIGYVVDVMNLIALLDTLPMADPERVGVLGHSLGGGVATYVMVLAGERVDAVVLYAPMSADQAVNFWHTWSWWDRELMDAHAMVYGTPDDSPLGYAHISPINYLDRVKMPVMIHHGTIDAQVPVEWSDELAQRLLGAGVDVTYYTYRNVGHTFTWWAWDLFMKRNLDFFDEYVRAASSSATDATPEAWP
jgi:dienelactone hydrolase